MTTKKLRVLLAEDSHEGGNFSLRSFFAESESTMDLTAVSSVSTLLPSIKLVDPEIIFIDLRIAHPEPVDVVRRLHRSSPGVPIIVFADANDKENAKHCLNEGALHFLLKDEINGSEINRVVRSALEKNTLTGLTDLLRDPLTRLHNRDAFLTLGEHTMDTAKRNRGTFVLLCACLENLNWIRKEQGPAAADNAIQEISEVLTKCLRGTDIVARIGDAQFSMLAPDAVEPSVQVLQQRIEKRLMVYNQSRGTRGSLELRISGGFWRPTDTALFAELLDSVEAGLRHDHALPTTKTLAVEGVLRG